MLDKNARIPELTDKISAIIIAHKPDWDLKVHLKPLNRVYLHSNFQYDIGLHADVRYVYIFSFVALFILIIACMNYTNLATASAVKRIREIGIKKVVGASRKQLIVQFISESLLMCCIALLIAVALVELLLPAFNNLSGKVLNVNFLNNYFVLPGLLAIVLLVGGISGCYPALFVSRLKPANIFKGSLHTGSSPFRKTLVVVQYTLSLIIIISTLVVSNQLKYIQNKDLGFNKENVLSFRVPVDNIEPIKNELMNHPNILSVGNSDIPLYEADAVGTIIHDWEGHTGESGLNSYFLRVGYNFLKTYKMKMTHGRFFSRDFLSDATEAIIINQAAVKAMGLESPIGKWINVLRPWRGQNNDFEIIGVLNDFHFKSLHSPIEPMVLTSNNDWRDWSPVIGVRIKAENFASTLDFIRRTYEKTVPNRAFEYHFLDVKLAGSYSKETRIATIFTFSAILSVFIFCLGLFGLASFVAEQRTKEIGVRKVLGASVQSIIYLMSKEFTKWVLFANIIAWPIAYYLGTNWLNNFAYRIKFNLWLFLFAGALTLIIALLTVSYQALKVAITNPVETLRYE